MQLNTRDGLYLDDRYKNLGRVASHRTPMIGPYDSKDRESVRLQLRLMRLAGADGIILNWYGTMNMNDYVANLAASDVIINETSAAGMLWTLCTEDRVYGSAMGYTGSITQAQTDLQRDWEYIRDSYIARYPGVVRRDSRGTSGRPVFFVFGPVTFQAESYWNTLFDAVFPSQTDRPYILGVDTGGSTVFETPDKDFHWPGDTLFTGTTTVSKVSGWLTSFYDKAATNSFNPVVGVAFPRFEDYYASGYVGGTVQSWWNVNVTDLSGQTLSLGMQTAHDRGAFAVQVATWNDWQEGTTIEPSAEEGFEQLLRMQQAVLGSRDEAAMASAVQEYNQVKASTWQYCDNVEFADRQDCGTSSSTETSCVAAGCCWSVTAQSGVPNCFQRATTPVCTCRTDLRDCNLVPQDRLCCCTHAGSSSTTQLPAVVAGLLSVLGGTGLSVVVVGLAVYVVSKLAPVAIPLVKVVSVV